MDALASALIQVQDTDANSTPTKSELIFNKSEINTSLRKCLTKATQAAAKWSSPT